MSQNCIVFCNVQTSCYACPMASDRMMQAIGRIDQALGRLEELAVTVESREPPRAPAMVDDPGRTRALEALRSLDSLISELKARG